MDTYNSSKIAADALLVLIPLYFISRKASTRTKKIAWVVLVLVILGLIGELGSKLSGA